MFDSKKVGAIMLTGYPVCRVIKTLKNRVKISKVRSLFASKKQAKLLQNK